MCRSEFGALPAPSYSSKADELWTKFLFRHNRLRRLELRTHWWWHFRSLPWWCVWEAEYPGDMSRLRRLWHFITDQVYYRCR